MKYIDAERLRAEIERRKKENMYVDLPMSIGRYYEDRDLLAFIDSLSEEPNKCLEQEQSQIDWESEIEEYWIASGWGMTISLAKFKVIARYFIGLALKARKEE